ncbi:lamin tail domain-containing protein [Reichenbachiella carrageenanivorans]|uniref:Lamin tail domain-containing protein n=1 Tax=Reichenbachiella carrageenanivorans TaxID=2979869 RepID=A0ABY6CYQ2_9BACT|nr:lamin tail domain-containing protein [Reichenbachiella carrageenanivorans]UXX78514.1 lamin tail domain-containing protein [Reichenbachiella carrageenanivorans]
MKYSSLLILIFLKSIPLFGQGLLLSDGTNNIGFTGTDGSGFSATPSAGQLNSNEWKITGMSDGNTTFGGEYITGDYTRGTSSGGVGTGGVYIFDVGGGNKALGVQPGGSDFTPGFFHLQTTNNAGATIQEIEIAYDLHIYNDQGRANSLVFAHSADDASYTQVTALDYISEEAADAIPAWQTTNRSTTLTALQIANSSNYYFSWGGSDVSGAGSRDEFAISNISITVHLDEVTAPRFITNFPIARNITTDNFDLVVQLDEPGTAYYVVLPTGAPTPSNEQVKTGNDASGASAGISGSMSVPTANTDASSNVPGLVDGLTYDVYVIAEDDEGSPNLQASPTMIQVEASIESIAITEFINNPFGSEPTAEWIEIFNFGETSVDLNGWTLSDEGVDNITIANSSLIIPANSFLILANNKALFETEWLGGTLNAQVIDIPNFSLGNTSDQIILSNNTGTAVWSVAYNDDDTEGIATYLDYSESMDTRSYGSMALPGIVRNGNDNLGATLGYEGNNFTTDNKAYSSTQGDTGSPLDGDYIISLPVTLISWEGYFISSFTHLQWQTGSELNNEGFYIEASRDGVEFYDLDFVIGQGTKSSTSKYSYQDHTFEQSRYYRLRQVDFDGTKTWSEVIYIKNKDLYSQQLYPNPIAQQVYYSQAFQNEPLRFSIHTSQTKTFEGLVDWPEAKQRLLALQPGIYYISINNQIQKVIKK